MLQNLLAAVAIAIGSYVLLKLFLAWKSRIPPQQAHERVEAGALLLDVRTQGEFASGTIEGAKNIPLANLEPRLGELDREREIVVFCASGMRSARAASILRGAGFTVHDLGPKAAW